MAVVSTIANGIDQLPPTEQIRARISMLAVWESFDVSQSINRHTLGSILKRASEDGRRYRYRTVGRTYKVWRAS